MLLLPRVLARRLAPLIAASPLFQQGSAAAASAAQPSSSLTPQALAGGASRVLNTLLGALLWPAAALVLAATATGECRAGQGRGKVCWDGSVPPQVAS